MTIEISSEVRQAIKQQRLEQYRKRYFELYLDKVALLANGDQEGALATDSRMKVIEDAYTAIELVSTEGGMV